MSDIREYLEQTREREGDKGWLRREPRTTHPQILAAVRTFNDEKEAAHAVPYDDLAEQYVEAVAGDLPDHKPHAHEDRDPLTDQLGHEVYIAKCLLRDQRDVEKAVLLRLQGFVTLGELELEPGRRYDVACATVYNGQTEPTYGPVKERCRLYDVQPSGEATFLPARSRVNGFRASRKALVRPS